MTASQRKSPARPIAALIGKTIDPVIRKRGLARADLLAWWPEIVGADYADVTVPDRIRWPKDGSPAVLFVRCDPAHALPLEYERETVRQRLNGFLGFPAIGEVRILQHPLRKPADAGDKPAEPDPHRVEALAERLCDVDEPLNAALLELGRRIIARS
jgi:hypothetical protein